MKTLTRLVPSLAAFSFAVSLPLMPSAAAFGQEVPPQEPEPKYQDNRHCTTHDGACACRKKKNHKCKEWLEPGLGWVCTSTSDEGTQNCD